MKHIIRMMIGVYISTLTLLIVMTITGRSNRRMELCESVPSAMETSLEEAVSDVAAEETMEEQEREDALLAAVAANLSVLLDSESALRMEVYGVDADKGLLSMKLSEEFQKAGGATASVSCERTVLIEREEESEEELEETQHRVRFFVSEDLYKAYRVQEGDTIAAPVSPTDAEASFAAWEDVNGYLADFSEPVLCDRDYFAAWE